jgi:hypothetical protein
VAGGGEGYTVPTVSYVSFGVMNQTLAGTEVWADAGSEANFPVFLPGSGPYERWVASSSYYGISGSGNSSVVYQNQFYVSVVPSPSGAGGVSTQPGWLDAGATITVNATASPGWEFGVWTGTGVPAVSGHTSSETFVVTGTVNQTAVFYPGLTIRVSGGGTVSYVGGGVKGSTSGTATIYVPVGSSVSLTESPPSILYVFGGWGGPLTGTAQAQSVQPQGPVTVTANFVLDYQLIGVVIVVAALAAAGGVIAFRRKEKQAGQEDQIATPETPAVSLD